MKFLGIFVDKYSKRDKLYKGGVFILFAIRPTTAVNPLRLREITTQMTQAVKDSCAQAPRKVADDPDNPYSPKKLVDLSDPVADEYRALYLAAAGDSPSVIYPQGAAFAIRYQGEDRGEYRFDFDCISYRKKVPHHFEIDHHRGRYLAVLHEIAAGLDRVNLQPGDGPRTIFKGCVFSPPSEPEGLIWFRRENPVDAAQTFHELGAVIGFLSQEGGIHLQKQCVLRPPLDTILEDQNFHLPPHYTLGGLLDILKGGTVPAALVPAEPLAPGVTQKVKITNPLGIHAREARKLSLLAEKYTSKMKVTSAQREADPKSMLSVLSAWLTTGTEVMVSAQGQDQDAALQAVVAFLENC